MRLSTQPQKENNSCREAFPPATYKKRDKFYREAVYPATQKEDNSCPDAFPAASKMRWLLWDFSPRHKKEDTFGHEAFPSST